MIEATTRTWLATIAVVVTVGLAAGCGDDDGSVKRPAPPPPPPAASGGAAGAAKTAGATAPKASAAPAIDPAYEKLMKAIIANCEIDPDGCSVSKCANNELDQFKRLWKAGKKKTGALDLLGKMAADADPVVVTAATNVMSQRFASSLNPDPGPVAKTTSGRLINAVAMLQGCHANQAARTTTHAAMLAGDDERLFELLESHASEYVAINSFVMLMHHGRLRPLERMKEMAKTVSPKKLAALLRAPRRMPDATDEERAAVCPWAQTFLGHESGTVAYEAGFTMSFCGGASVDALLAEGEKRRAAGTFAPPFANVFREPCAQLLAKPRTEEQQASCEKVYSFLEKVAKNKKLDSEVRGQALWNIYYQERTQATYDRLRKHARSRDKVIAAKVADALNSLEKTYGAKK